MTFADGNLPSQLSAPPPPPPPAPERRSGRRRKPLSRSRRILVGVVAGIVALAVLGAGAYAAGVPVTRWLGFGDDREYLPSAGVRTYGDGNLERTVAPHFGLDLPCEASDVHWGDREAGPTGTLYLTFRTTDECLATFINGNSLDVDSVAEVPDAPQSYRWRVPDGVRYYFGRPDTSNDLRVWVDESTSDPTVWAIAKHFQP